VTDQRAADGGRASEPRRRPTDPARLRREQARRARSAHPARGTTPSSTASAFRRPADAGRDELPPRDRGPVRALVRDTVDSRRRLVGLFLPVLGVVVVCALGPASDLQRYVLFGSLAMLAAVAVDAVLLGVEVTRTARARFPAEHVPGLATGWYAFLRAHRSRQVRRPRPRVTRGGARIHPQ
jgi:hypothetical protein